MSKSKPPRTKFWSDAELVHFHLGDEEPRLGSGHRWYYCKFARDYVHVWDDYKKRAIKIKMFKGKEKGELSAFMKRLQKRKHHVEKVQ